MLDALPGVMIASIVAPILVRGGVSALHGGGGGDDHDAHAAQRFRRGGGGYRGGGADARGGLIARGGQGERRAVPPCGMPLPNRVDPFGNLFATPARGTLLGNRGGRFHGDGRKLGAPALGLQAVDLLRAAIQEPPPRVWGERLHRIVLPRRGDRLCRRPPALLRMPAQEAERSLSRCCSPRGTKRSRFAGMSGTLVVPPPTMDDILHAERLAGKEKRTSPPTRSTICPTAP